MSLSARLGVRHPKLIAVIQAMEENLEEPLSRGELAASADLSSRQLERLFRKYLNRSPARYYVELRLKLSEAVRQLRKELHLTQVQLAELVHSSQSRVAKVESADESVSLTQALGDAFDVARPGLAI